MEAQVTPKKKVKKPGVIYLNYIPRYMTVKKVREHFSEFGEVRRLFLKPEKSKKPGKPSKFFSEGWVEFASKKVAKRVAECLNGAQVGGRRHSPYYDALWSIKYLHKFQWSNLNERKAYEKARKEQRMRAEIAQVKREVNFYTKGVEKMKRLKKHKNDNEVNVTLINQILSKPFKAEDKVNDDMQATDERNSLLLRQVFGNSNTN
ncbi:pre-rRNA-processing protein esf2-like [Stegodyphus dumicola]|uniref:pre-rRNA-processing protein esf2-like n=1 Tax=Stegodyphus dumicola TaxID=202533 RepID=UPI0015B168AD|nr:pre-rRNA-processing protein esf2-like [Stegodyphus dumicola]